MAQFRRILAAPQVGQVYLEFAALARDLTRQINQERDARRRSLLIARRRAVLQIEQEFEEEMKAIARRTSAYATQQIRVRIKRVRPSAGAPNLAKGVRSRPIAPLIGGVVGVADEAYLDRIRNPRTPGYGPYWRAQEFGTGTAPPHDPPVPSQRGRKLRGTFYVPGSARPSQSMFRVHAYFKPGGPKGGKGGKGTIRREIPAKHFLRDGADAAAQQYRAEIARLQSRTVARLTAVMTGRAVAAPGIRRRPGSGPLGRS